MNCLLCQQTNLSVFQIFLELLLLYSQTKYVNIKEFQVIKKSSFAIQKAQEKYVVVKVFFKLTSHCNLSIRSFNPLTYTHNIDNTQLHTNSHTVAPENTQLHAPRTHFLLTLNYTHSINQWWAVHPREHNCWLACEGWIIFVLPLLSQKAKKTFCRYTQHRKHCRAFMVDGQHMTSTLNGIKFGTFFAGNDSDVFYLYQILVCGRFLRILNIWYWIT